MQTSIAQTLSLVMHGNAVLSGRDANRFWPDGLAFRFCDSVSFVALGRGLFGAKTETLARDPMDWLRGLRGQCAGLRVYRTDGETSDLPDHVSVAFVGGGSRWLIETVEAHASSLWEDEWRVDPGPSGSMVTNVRYHRLTDAWRGLAPAERDVAAVHADLAAVLTAMVDFSRRAETSFTRFFEQGLAALNDRAPANSGLAPPGFLDPAAGQLLAAGEAAWVFGGMGSWNDIGFPGDLVKEGDRLTASLFATIQEGFAAAANSTFPSLLA